MEEYGNGNANEIIGGVTTTGEKSYGGINNVNNANIAGQSAASFGYTDPFASTNNVSAGATVNKTASSLPTELGFWSRVKAFFLQEIRVELTPRQKKIEKELNDFLFQEITFGKKKN